MLYTKLFLAAPWRLSRWQNCQSVRHQVSESRVRSSSGVCMCEFLDDLGSNCACLTMCAFLVGVLAVTLYSLNTTKYFVS